MNIDGENLNPVHPVETSTVTSLIAKFNKAAAAFDEEKNALSARFIGSRRPQDGASSSKCVNESNTSSSSGDKAHVKNKGLIIDDVILKYFPEKPAQGDATNPRMTSSLVASIQAHVALGEQQKPGHHQNDKQRHSGEKTTTFITVSSPCKPLCPFRLNNKTPVKDTSLIFGKNSTNTKLKPTVDMFPSPFKGVSSVDTGATKLSTSEIATSPMDKNHPGIVVHIALDNMKAPNIDTSAKNEVLALCEQKDPVPINVIFDDLSKLQKVGEGVFGEVFIGEFNGISRVYKVVPIEGHQKVNGEFQKTYAEILPEITISMQLSKLNADKGYNGYLTDGYIKIYNARLAQGVYPEMLVKTWKIWDQKHSSDNDCPDFSSEQLYMIFEFEYGGKDAESFVFTNSRQAFSLVLQVVHILAVGESAMEFEHRDLHWGNILVQPTDSENISYTLDGKVLQIPSGGIKGYIIDFTLARIINDKLSPIFLDLKNDEEQFLGAGDHQFDIYRMMRCCNRNQWAPFHPKTNIYWIHYLADKLVSSGRYLDTESTEHRFFIKQLRIMKDVIMRYNSSLEFVLHKSCEYFKNVEPPAYRLSSDTKTLNRNRNGTTNNKLNVMY